MSALSEAGSEVVKLAAPEVMKAGLACPAGQAAVVATAGLAAVAAPVVLATGVIAGIFGLVGLVLDATEG